MAFAELRGLRFYYETAGRGRPLVMIMGLGANADWWGPGTIDALARHFRVLAFDNRDAGRSSPAAAPYTIRDMADDTVALMDHVGMDRAHVVGASMGGMIAQELALGYPDKVDRLVLACTTPGQSSGIPPTPEAMADLMRDRSNLSVAEVAQSLVRVLFSPAWVAANSSRLPEILARLGEHPISAEGYQRQLLAISRFEAGPRLGEIRCPTLVMHGTADPLVPVENGRILARLIPGARLELFEGAAHGFLTEQPERFLSVLTDFLSAPVC